MGLTREKIDELIAENPFWGLVGFCSASPTPPGCTKCGWAGLPPKPAAPWSWHTSKGGTWWKDPKDRWWPRRPYWLPTHFRKDPS